MSNQKNVRKINSAQICSELLIALITFSKGVTVAHTWKLPPTCFSFGIKMLLTLEHCQDACVCARERERERWHTRQFHSASADCETSDKINSDASRWRPDTFLFFVPSRCVWVIWFILPFCAKRWTISVGVSWLALSSHNQCIITAWSASFCLVNKSVWWVCSHLVASLLLVSIHFTLLLPKIFIFPLFQTSYDKCKLVFCTGMIVFPSMVRSVTSCSLMCFTSLRLLCQPPVAGEQVSILSRVPPTRPHTKHQAPSRRLT